MHQIVRGAGNWCVWEQLGHLGFGHASASALPGIPQTTRQLSSSHQLHQARCQKTASLCDQDVFNTELFSKNSPQYLQPGPDARKYILIWSPSYLFKIYKMGFAEERH